MRKQRNMGDLDVLAMACVLHLPTPPPSTGMSAASVHPSPSIAAPRPPEASAARPPVVHGFIPLPQVLLSPPRPPPTSPAAEPLIARRPPPPSPPPPTAAHTAAFIISFSAAIEGGREPIDRGAFAAALAAYVSGGGSGLALSGSHVLIDVCTAPLPSVRAQVIVCSADALAAASERLASLVRRWFIHTR